MPQHISKKRNYFFNPKNFFAQRNIFEDTIRKIYNTEYVLDQQTFNEYNVLSNNCFINNAVCKIKNVSCNESIYLFKDTDDKCLNHYHLIRNKKQCVVVIGNDLLNLQAPLEQTISQSFGSQCAKIIDADCYVWQVKNTNNTINLFELEKIIKYLEQFNYLNTKIIFQMIDPIDCIKSIWWKFPTNIIKSKNTDVSILKNHLSYHFIDIEELEGSMNFIDNIDVFKDSFVLKYPSKNKMCYLSPQEFFDLYEWSILSYLDLLKSEYKNRLPNLDVIVWRDFSNFENKDLKIKKAKKSLIEFNLDKSIDLYYSKDKEFFYSLFRNSFRYKSKLLNQSKKRFNQKVFNNPVVLPVPKTHQLLFNDSSNKFETGILSPTLPKNFMSTINNFCSYILSQAGWHK